MAQETHETIAGPTLIKCKGDGVPFFESDCSVANIDSKKNRVPDFLIETILNKIPERNDHNCQTIVSNPVNPFHGTPSRENKISSASVIRHFQTLSGLFGGNNFAKNVCMNPLLEPLGLLPNDQKSATTLTPYRKFDEMLQTSSFGTSRLHHLQQMFLSSLEKPSSIAYSRFYETFGISPSFSGGFNYNIDFSIRHFENRFSEDGNANIENSVSSVPEMRTLSPGVLTRNQPNYHKPQARVNKTDDILFQLNELSEKIDMRNRTISNQKSSKMPTHPQQSRFYHPPIPLDLRVSGQSSAVLSERKRNATSFAEESKHPAWVFCTRYSDRPCAGPRVRKPKKDVQKQSQNHGKRERTAFSEAQLTKLQKEFQDCPYLTEDRRNHLSQDLGLTVAQIKVWFQNKRAKVKKASGVQSQLKMGLIASGIYEHGTVMTDND